MDKGRLFRVICGLMIAIIVGILIVLFVSDDDNTIPEGSIDMTADYSATSDWMSYLPDDKYLSEITIPGTHNSCARNVAFGYAMRNQNTDVSEQLENGYRYLDFRIALEETDENSDIVMVHKLAKCHVSGSFFSEYLYFDDVMKDVYSFLEEHPSESVIINIKKEDDAHSVAEIQKLLLEKINQNKDKWYTENEIPTLGRTRGKAVLCTRFEDANATGTTGLNMIWSEQDNTTPADLPYDLYVIDDYRLWVQDRYKYSVEDKFDAVVDGLENCEADENTVFLNFLSTSGDGPVGHPYGYAKTLNGLLMEYNLKSNTSYGTVIVDFGDANLARHIYYSNF